MQDIASAVTTGGTVVLWAGLCVQFVIRRGQPHREVLSAAAGLAVAITMVLPPVANSVPRIFGASGPCTLFQNIWGVLSSGLILLVIAAGRGRAVTVAAAVATGAMMLTEGWLANVTIPPPAGWCLASSAVPAASLFWWLMITWHLSARVAALAVCLRDAAALRANSWAQSGVWWYTTGFAVSTLYWTLAAAMLVTERRWPQMDILSDVLTGSGVSGAAVLIGYTGITRKQLDRHIASGIGGAAWGELVDRAAGVCHVLLRSVTKCASGVPAMGSVGSLSEAIRAVRSSLAPSTPYGRCAATGWTRRRYAITYWNRCRIGWRNSRCCMASS